MLTVIGLAIILTIVVLLLTEKVSPVICLIMVPLIGALIGVATGLFEFSAIEKFYKDGVSSVLQVVIMFVFAILFFGVMNDVGLFDPIIKGMIRLTRGNVIAVCIGTVLVSIVAHLDGAGASTFLLVVPPLLPLYKRLKMNPYLLFLLLAASAGVVNMLPWGGPVGRIASVLKVDPVGLWRDLLVIQIIGIVLLLILAVVLGLREQRRIRQLDGAQPATGNASSETDYENHGTQGDEAAITHDLVEVEEEETPERKALLRPKLRWVNAAIFAATLGVLVWGVLPSGYVFMIALCLALLINYPQPKMQMERISAHAGGAIMMASIILAAGTFLGILKTSGMLNSIAVALVDLLPASALPHLHLIIGFFGIPLELVLNTDAYYFALFPVVEQVTSHAGVASTSAAFAMLIGSIVGTFISPFSPALWMGLGLAKLSMGQHIRYSFFWVWGVSLTLMAIAFVIGVI